MHRLLPRGLLLGAISLALACSPVKSKGLDDAAVDPGDEADAQTDGIDAGLPDARPPASAPPSTDIGTGGAKLQGGGYSMDVQLGHPFGQGKTTGNSTTTEGGAAVKP